MVFWTGIGNPGGCGATICLGGRAKNKVVWNKRQREERQWAWGGPETKRVFAGSGQLSSYWFHPYLNLGCPLGVHELSLWPCYKCSFWFKPVWSDSDECKLSQSPPAPLFSFFLLFPLLCSALLSAILVFSWAPFPALRLSSFAWLQIKSP